MSLSIHSLFINSQNPAKLVEFYKRVANADPFEVSKDGQFSMFQFGPCVLAIGPHDKLKGNNNTPERYLLNFETEDVKAETSRLQSIGAKVVQEPYHPAGEPSMLLATFADPDGNYFQIGSPHHTN